MRLLLDAHTLLWWRGSDLTRSAEARAHISHPRQAAYVSTASAWEIAIKRAIGKLESPDDLVDQLGHHRFEPLPITVAHAPGPARRRRITAIPSTGCSWLRPR